jgi:hypothetical protein
MENCCEIDTERQDLSCAKWLEASSFSKAVFGLGEMALDDTPLMPASGASYAYAASFVSFLTLLSSCLRALSLPSALGFIFSLRARSFCSYSWLWLDHQAGST